MDATALQNAKWRKTVFCLCVQMNNDLYCIGGVDANIACSHTMISYNCTTDEWTEHPPMPRTSVAFAAAVVNRHEFVALGFLKKGRRI